MIQVSLIPEQRQWHGRLRARRPVRRAGRRRSPTERLQHLLHILETARIRHRVH